MQVSRFDILALSKLSTTKDLVPVDEIPLAFRSDFQKFFFGKTLTKDQNNRLMAYPNDIKQWVRYVFYTYKD